MSLILLSSTPADDILASAKGTSLSLLLGTQTVLLLSSTDTTSITVNNNLPVGYKSDLFPSLDLPTETISQLNYISNLSISSLLSTSLIDAISIEILLNLLSLKKLSIENRQILVDLKNILLATLLQVSRLSIMSLGYQISVNSLSKLLIEQLLTLNLNSKVPIDIQGLAILQLLHELPIEFLGKIPHIKIPIEYLIRLAYDDLTITSSDPPDADVGVPYSFQFEAIGGVPPYTWTKISGTLPGGLTLSRSGLLSGTPTSSGSVNIQVAVTDNIADRISLEFSSPGIFTVLSQLPIETLQDVTNCLLSSNLHIIITEAGLAIVTEGGQLISTESSLIGIGGCPLTPVEILGDASIRPQLPIEFDGAIISTFINFLPIEFLSQILDLNKVSIEHGGIASFSTNRFLPLEYQTELNFTKDLAIQALLDLQPFNYKVFIEYLEGLPENPIIPIEIFGVETATKLRKWVLLHRSSTWTRPKSNPHRR